VKLLTSRFGVNLLVYLTMLKFSLRGVLRRIKDFAFHLNPFDITPKGIPDAILRVGEACKSAYFTIPRKSEMPRGIIWMKQECGFSVKTIGLSGRPERFVGNFRRRD